MLYVMFGFGLGIENETVTEKEEVGESQGKYFPSFMSRRNKKKKLFMHLD